MGFRRLIAADESCKKIRALFRRNRTPLVLAGLGAVATVVGAIALRSSVPVVIVTAIVLATSLLLFAYLLPAYTQQGRKLKDEIDGLRLYLGVAEGDDLARLQNPRLTPEEFAGQLPYALALGVEKTWADRFAAVLGAAAVAQAVSHYYTGSSTDSLADVGSLASSLGELGSTASAAASPPGSSSGSGGRRVERGRRREWRGERVVVRYGPGRCNRKYGTMSL